MPLTQTDIKKIESLINRVLIKKFGPVSQKVNSLDRKFGSLDQKVNSLDRKFDKKTDMIFGQIGNIYNQIDALNDKTASLEDKMSLLPTKDDFFTRMDQVMGELQAIREEHTILGHQVSDHETRITVLEENRKSAHFAVAV